VNASARAWVAGVTGGIGSGKTALCRRLAGLGVRVVDADETAREITDSDPAVRSALEREFGPGLYGPDGRLRRGELAGRAFGLPGRVEALNRIVWPRLREALRARIRGLMDADPETPVALDMAVLYEAGCEDLVDWVVAVEAPEDQRVRRVREARGWDEATVRRRMAAQWDPAEKSRRADFVLRNPDGAGVEDPAAVVFEALRRLSAVGRPNSR
jgi:dephospho-CoA kinase